MTKRNLDAIAFNNILIEEFRANGGKIGERLAGGRLRNSTLLVLTTTGAKSGRQRLTPLAYVDIDGKIIIVGSSSGADAHPAWVYNLRANPDARIEVGSDEYDVTARELPSAERNVVWTQVVELAPWFADYQRKTTRQIPLFELTRA